MGGHRNEAITRRPSTIVKRRRTRGEAPGATAELDFLTPTTGDSTATPSDKFLHENWRELGYLSDPTAATPVHQLHKITVEGGITIVPHRHPAPPGADHAAPAVSPAAALPDSTTSVAAAPSVEPRVNLDERLAKIRANLRSFTFNPFWENDIVEAFKGLSAAEFVELQERLGDISMNEVFDQISPFGSSLIGSLGPIVRGSAKLNEQRVKFIIETKDWGSRRGSFYQWMFDTMSVPDIRDVLQRLADEAWLSNTVFSVEPRNGAIDYAFPELIDSLRARGVDPSEFADRKVKIGQGLWRGAQGMWTGAWSRTAFGSGPGNEFTYLPDAYQKLYLEGSNKEFVRAASRDNIARGVLSETTLGASEKVFGVYEAGQLTIAAIDDFENGRTGAGAEKLVPVAVMIALVLLGRRAGKLGTVTSSEEAALARTGATAGIAAAEIPIATAGLRAFGKTTEGLSRFLVSCEGEFFELVLDPRGNGRMIRLKTGDVALIENGAVRSGPPLLPTAANAPGAASPLPALPSDRPVIVRFQNQPALFGPEPLPDQPTIGSPRRYERPGTVPASPSWRPLWPQQTGSSPQEQHEPAFMAVTDPGGILLPPRARGVDWFVEPQLQYTTVDWEGGIPVVTQKFAGGVFVSAKEMKPVDAAGIPGVETNLRANVGVAVRKLDNAFKPASPSNVYEYRNQKLTYGTSHGQMGWRVEFGRPDRVVIRVQLPPGVPITDPLNRAAADELKGQLTTLMYFFPDVPVDLELHEVPTVITPP